LHRKGFPLRRSSALPIAGGLLLSLSLLASPALASSGFAAEPASQILQTATSATEHARSFAVDGSVSQSNENVTLHVTLSASKAGGTVTVDGQTIHLAKVGSMVYFSAGAAFWQQNGGQTYAQLFANRWVEAPASNSDFASFLPFLEPSQFVSQLLQVPSGASITKGTTSKVSGQSVVALKSSGTGNNGTLYVATGSPHYIVRLTGGGGSSGSGSLNFSRYNKPVTIATPKNALNYQALENGSSS
jgi:hypothetical protein